MGGGGGGRCVGAGAGFVILRLVCDLTMRRWGAFVVVEYTSQLTLDFSFFIYLPSLVIITFFLDGLGVGCRGRHLILGFREGGTPSQRAPDSIRSFLKNEQRTRRRKCRERAFRQRVVKWAGQCCQQHYNILHRCQ